MHKKQKQNSESVNPPQKKNNDYPEAFEELFHWHYTLAENPENIMTLNYSYIQIPLLSQFFSRFTL